MQGVVGAGLGEVLLLGAALLLEGAYPLKRHLPEIEALMVVTTKNVPLLREVFPLVLELLILELRPLAILMLRNKGGIICLFCSAWLNYSGEYFSEFACCAMYEELEINAGVDL